MKDLKESGKYTVPAAILEKLQQEFYGGFCDDASARETIRNCFEKYHYLCDTHTAVAVNVYEQYAKASGDTTPVIIASTASPYKFAPAVLKAVAGGDSMDDGFAVMEKLAQATSTVIPAPLDALRGSVVRHKNTVAKENMADFIKKVLA